MQARAGQAKKKMELAWTHAEKKNNAKQIQSYNKV